MLIGHLGTRYFLVTEIEETVFEEGDPLIVRMVTAGRVVGYETMVASVIDTPVKLYFLAYPQSVQIVNLRKSGRLQVFFPGEIQALIDVEEDQIALLKVMLLNLSSGGCYFSSSHGVDSPAKIKLSFSFPGETHTHYLGGTVLESGTSDSVYTHRVQFDGTVQNLPITHEIDRWIIQNQTYAPASRFGHTPFLTVN